MYLFPTTEYDFGYINRTIPIFAGGLFVPELLPLEAYEDGLSEELEGFVLLVYVDESGLDERDMGFVNVTRSTFLMRINQSGNNSRST